MKYKEKETTLPPLHCRRSISKEMSRTQPHRFTGKVSTRVPRKGEGFRIYLILISNLSSKKSLDSNSILVDSTFATTSKPLCPIPSSPSFSFYWITHSTSMVHHLASKRLLPGIMFLSLFKVHVNYVSME